MSFSNCGRQFRAADLRGCSRVEEARDRQTTAAVRVMSARYDDDRQQWTDKVYRWSAVPYRKPVEFMEYTGHDVSSGATLAKLVQQNEWSRRPTAEASAEGTRIKAVWGLGTDKSPTQPTRRSGEHLIDHVYDFLLVRHCQYVGITDVRQKFLCR